MNEQQETSINNNGMEGINPERHLQDRSVTGISPEGERQIIQLLIKQNELLEEIQAGMVQSALKMDNKRIAFGVHVSGVDMSINAMAGLMMKWIIASIPVGIILGFVVLLLSGCMRALF